MKRSAHVSLPTERNRTIGLLHAFFSRLRIKGWKWPDYLLLAASLVLLIALLKFFVSLRP